MAGALRFAIEFVRVNERLLGSMTLAHLISAAIAIAGVLMAVGARPRRRAAPAR
jgi:hypothetical protein